MRRTLLAIAALSSALTAAPVHAKPVMLTPSSPWNVDFGEDRCRLARLFTDGTNEHLLYFEQHFPASGFGLTAAGSRLRFFKDRIKTEVRAADAGDAAVEVPFKGEMARFKEALIFSALSLGQRAPDGVVSQRRTALPMLDATAAGAFRYVSLKQGSRELRFETGSLGEPFKVLNQCTTALIEGWGLDGAKHQTATKLPQWTNEQEIVRKIADLYPTAAAIRGEQAVTRMRVIVDEQGAVADCVIVKATTTEKLESPACRIMKNARFEPGLDAEGKPMRSYYATNLTYVLN